MRKLLLLLLFMLPLSVATAATEDDEPCSTPEVTVWANQAIVTLNSYSYKNSTEHLKKAAKYFTPGAWKVYVEALDKTNNLKTVKANRLTVSSVATLPPEIIKKGRYGRHYLWKIKMPVLIVYKNENQMKKQHQTITMDVINVPATQGVHGLAIIRYIMETEKNNEKQ